MLKNIRYAKCNTNTGLPFNIKILVHAKYPEKIKSPWLKQHVVTTFQYRPEWGSLETPKTMFRLMQEVRFMIAEGRLFLYYYSNIGSVFG